MSIAHDIALVFSPHWSPRLAREIAENFPDRSQVFTTSYEELRDRIPKYPQWVEDFVTWRKEESPEFYQNKIKEHGLTAITRYDERYPPLLKEIHDPPLVLFIDGYISHSTDSWCAVVGSRQATAYGRSQAFHFGKELAEHNVGVVSGLAYGIDEHAIRGACSANGKVIAVLAGGHPCFSEREKELKNLILAQGGAVVSECIPQIQPQNYFFPIRNRIIAGIAKRTLVIEGKIKSGSLVTAQKALEENRDVFALPGPVTSATSKGCHKLIKEGATLCSSVHDILDIPTQEEGPCCKPSTIPEPESHNSFRIPEDFPTPLHKKLWDFLQTPHSFDSLVEYAKEKGSEVAGILNIWEIEGYLALKNGRYHLVPYEHSSHC